MFPTLTKISVHLRQRCVLMMQSNVLQESPELHSCHDKGIVRTLIVTKGTVVVVDLAEAGHVTHDHE